MCIAKSFRHKIVIVESEYEDDALVKPETVSSPIVDKGKDQSSTQWSGVLSKKREKKQTGMRDDKRHRDRMVMSLDLKCGDPESKSRSDHPLNL